MTAAFPIRRYASDPMAFFAYAFEACGLVMADFQRERFELFSESAISISQGKKPKLFQIWAEAVKGASKDCDAALVLLWLIAFAKVALDVQVGASDEDQSNEMLKAAKAWLATISWLDGRVRAQSSKLVCKSTDSTITFVASDASGGAHGSRCQLYVINEITHIAKTEFWQTLLDNAVKVDGCVWILTNAGFTETDAYKLREACRTSPRCGFHQFKGPTPWQDAEKVEARRVTSPPINHMRLFEGIWAAGTGDALGRDVIDAAFCQNVRPLQGPSDGMVFVGGVDLSVSRDNSVLVILGKTRDDRYRLADLICWTPPRGGKIDQSVVEDAILQAHRTFGLKKIACDPYQCESLVQRLQKVGIPIEVRQQTGKQLTEQAMLVCEVFNSRRIDLFEHEMLRRELSKLYIEAKSYGLRLVSPRDNFGHGDIVTALAIALTAAKPLAGGPSTWGGPITTGALERSYLSNRPSGTCEKVPLGGYRPPGPDWSRAR
jgi:hypothetical protein